jgi:hypothetical protein
MFDVTESLKDYIAMDKFVEDEIPIAICWREVATWGL